MSSLTDDERTFLVSSLGLTEAQGAVMSLSDLRRNYYSDGGGGVGAGSILAEKIYAPDVGVSMNTANAAMTALDAVNLSVTFTVPDSGKVFVVLTAEANNVGSPIHYWGLMDGAAEVVGTCVRIENYLNSQLSRPNVVIPLSGLTPGAEKTYAWGQKQANGGTVYTYAGDGGSLETGPAIMQVIQRA